jgi:hypothetical protein
VSAAGSGRREAKFMPRWSLGLLAPLLLATSPVLAQLPPPGVYRCTSPDMAPAGVLTVTDTGQYQYQSVSDADFTPIPDDPANGAGQLVAAGDALTPQSGPLKEHFAVTGKATSSMGITSINFAETNGDAALVCTP